ncbi:MAG: P-loop NTPase, partial [Armatimonadetes bacterium]|nr:P-loop NTPase [Armatimonadota bacterium]
MSGFICPHCGQRTDIFSSGGGERMADQMSVPFLGRVPIAPGVVELSDEGRAGLGPAAPEPVREAFAGIVEALIKALS